MNVEGILKVASPKPKLHSEAIAICTLCKRYQIHFEPAWIRREFNQEANELSKLANRDDDMFNPNIFTAWDILWGPHTIDCISTFRTHQVLCFCSRWLNPCNEGVGAFTLDWSGENNWIFPAPYLMPKVLKHMNTIEKQELLSSCRGLWHHGGLLSLQMAPKLKNLYGTGWKFYLQKICFSQPC